MTEWFRPARQSSKESSNPWTVEGNLYDDLERPRDMPKITQELGGYGLRGFPGFTQQERAENIHGSFKGTQAEMDQLGLTDERLAYQAGTPRSPSRPRVDQLRRPRRQPVDEDDFSQHSYLH